MSKIQTTQERYDGAMEIKRKLDLRIILLINYMTEENLFVYAECSSIKHAASRFSVRKNVTKKNKRKKNESDTWMDWHLGSRSCQFLSRSSMYYIMLTLHNPIKPLNIVSTVFLEELILHLLLRGVQTSWDGWNLPNKQFQSKSICFSSLLSRVNK